MTEAEVAATIQEHVTAAKNAIRAGFDGVELHGANGYLTEQFLNPDTNRRTDGFGGSVERRTRFALDVVAAMAAAIGKERVGIRLSPYGAASGMKPYPEVDETYAHLAAQLSKLEICYVHVVDHSALGAPPVPAEVKRLIRQGFHGVYIAAGGFTLASAEKAIDSKEADLVAFGRPFLANPDLVARFAHGWPVATPDMKTAYTPGPQGYTDYPTTPVRNPNTVGWRRRPWGPPRREAPSRRLCDPFMARYVAPSRVPCLQPRRLPSWRTLPALPTGTPACGGRFALPAMGSAQARCTTSPSTRLAARSFTTK